MAYICVMKLNKNSWYNKLYTAMWKEYTPQKSLCPYFWKLVICFLTIIPVFVLAILPFIAMSIANVFIKQDKFDNSAKKASLKYESFIINIVFNIAVGLILSMIYVFVPIDLGKPIYELGIFMWVAVIMVLLVSFIMFLSKKISKRKEIKKEKMSDSDSLLKVTGEFIKAKYNKYCPTIEWVGTDTNEDLPKTNPINNLYDND